MLPARAIAGVADRALAPLGGTWRWRAGGPGAVPGDARGWESRQVPPRGPPPLAAWSAARAAGAAV